MKEVLTGTVKTVTIRNRRKSKKPNAPFADVPESTIQFDEPNWNYLVVSGDWGIGNKVRITIKLA